MLKPRTTGTAAAALVISMGLGLCALTAVRELPNDVRAVPARRGVPLRELLRPDDQTVEVYRFENFYTGGDDDPTTELEGLTRHSEAVVTVKAIEISSRLTADEDWIESTMTGEVIEVLKNTSPFLVVPGTRLSIPFEGGEVIINGKKVRAVATSVDQPRTGHHYLYFLFASAGELRPLLPIHTFELQGQSIRRLSTQGEWGLDRGVDVDWVLQTIRTKANLPTVRVPQ